MALRRVSIVLFVFGLLKLGISGILWKDRQTVGKNSTLQQSQMSILHHNYLSLTVLALGMFLMKLSLVGFCLSKKMSDSHKEDVQVSRYAVSKGFLFMVCYLKFTAMMFTTFTFAAIWFTFFNTGIAQWMESAYFIDGQQSE